MKKIFITYFVHGNTIDNEAGKSTGAAVTSVVMPLDLSIVVFTVIFCAFIFLFLITSRVETFQ